MKVVRLLRPLRVALLSVAALVTLFVLAVTIENWRGPRALAAEKARLAAAGEQMDYISFVPPPIPPENNFMADPFLRTLDSPYHDAAFMSRYGQFLHSVGGYPLHHVAGYSRQLGSWSKARPIEFRTLKDEKGNERIISPQEVMSAFAPIEEDILRLQQRARECSLAQLDPESDLSRPNWNISDFLHFSQFMTWRAAAALDLRQVSDAYADAAILMRMEKAADSYPAVVGVIMATVEENLVTQIFWEGTISGAWSNDQYERFRDFFYSVDPWENLIRALHAEGARTMTIFADPAAVASAVIAMLPKDRWQFVCPMMGPGLAAENALRTEDAYGEAVSLFDPIAGRFDSDKAEQYLARNRSWTERINSYHAFGAATEESLIRVEIRLSKQIPAWSVGELVAALEIYHHENHDYPTKLDDLLPRYLPRIPTSVLTGEPPAYGRIDSDHFRLTSARWNDGASPPEWAWRAQALSVGPNR